jgi:hypothetical protein
MLRKHKGLVALALLGGRNRDNFKLQSAIGRRKYRVEYNELRNRTGWTARSCRYPEPKRPTYKELDARNVKAPERVGSKGA